MMSAPKGAISVNENPTPKNTISVSNSTTPKKEIKQDPNAGMNARLDTLIATTGKVNSISTLKIQ
jgi:hypothetical protein